MTITVPCTDSEFEQIHQLNYKTFVDEIPQHKANDEGRLVDKFHDKNKYIIAKNEDGVIAMISYTLERPFSLDKKLENLDSYLPEYRRVAEVRLLAVDKTERKKIVTYLLLKKLCEELINLNVDTAIISGTTRELKLYEKIGFTPFGNLVGTNEALYQPMYITLNQLRDDFKRN
ncbi:MAG TPA: GNAT family N-acetyltransferase [Segetibacter sp.]